MSVLNAPHFHDEQAAIDRLEAILWPDGPICPHCGNTEKVYAIRGKSARPGLKTCGACRQQFTVKVGTLFEDSHVPMHKWWQAVHLLCSSKKGISPATRSTGRSRSPTRRLGSCPIAFARPCASDRSRRRA